MVEMMIIKIWSGGLQFHKINFTQLLGPLKFGLTIQQVYLKNASLYELYGNTGQKIFHHSQK